MPSLQGTETAKNLMHSFVAETSVAARYDYYAKEAKKEGYVQIQNIFEETARNEREHAKRFLKHLKEDYNGEKIGFCEEFPVMLSNTKDNLMEAIQGEAHEFLDLYPKYAEVAKKEGFPEIQKRFIEISEVEKQHKIRFQKLLKNIENGMVFNKKEEVRWKCNNCGYVHTATQALKVCPACDHEQEHFEMLCENY